MNFGSFVAIAFWLGLLLFGFREWLRARDERAWRRDEARCARYLAEGRYVSGLSGAVLAAIPDDELSDAELEFRIRAEARRLGEIADLEQTFALDSMEPSA